MARLLRTGFGLNIALDNGVGPGSTNARTDVGIIQFALSVLTGGLVGPLGNVPGTFTVPGQNPILVDGFFGPQTLAYITAYQQIRVQSPGPSLGPLPAPNGAFSGRHDQGGWPFTVLAADAAGVGARPTLADVLQGNPAPPWLKDAFFG